MEDVIKLTDRQFDYLKKLVTDDIQKTIAGRDNDATLDRADLLLRLIKIHALEKRKANQGVAFEPETEEDEPVSSEPIEKKVCKKCGIAKPFNDFAKNDNMKDGRINTCRACVNATQNERNRKKVK